MGDVIGDLNSKRGQIQGMEPRGNARRPRPGPAGRDVRLRDRAALHDAGPRNISMEFSRYCRSAEGPGRRADREVQEGLKERRRSTMAKQKFERSKPHVNVGTIGHVDHGKTTLTAAITKYLALKGGPTSAPSTRSTTLRKSAQRGITIAITHVEYETANAPLRARRLPRPRRLHQEHDHRRRPDGRRDPGRVGRRRPDAPDPRAHPARPPGGGARRWSSSSTRSTWWTTRCCSTWSRWRSASCSASTTSPATTSRSSAARRSRRSSRPATDQDAPEYECIKELMDAVDNYIPTPIRDGRQAVPDADRGRLRHQGPRHGGHRPHRAWRGPDRRRGRDRRHPAKSRKTVVTGVEMFQKTLDEGQAGDNVGCCCAASSATTSSAAR